MDASRDLVPLAQDRVHPGLGGVAGPSVHVWPGRSWTWFGTHAGVFACHPLSEWHVRQEQPWSHPGDTRPGRHQVPHSQHQNPSPSEYCCLQPEGAHLALMIDVPTDPFQDALSRAARAQHHWRPRTYSHLTPHHCPSHHHLCPVCRPCGWHIVVAMTSTRLAVPPRRRMSPRNILFCHHLQGPFLGATRESDRTCARRVMSAPTRTFPADTPSTMCSSTYEDRARSRVWLRGRPGLLHVTCSVACGLAA